MNRSNQASVKRSIPLSLLLGALLGIADVYAQDGEQNVPDDPAAPGVSSKPDNIEADQDLLVVQQQMVSRALEYARELDFESAEQILEDASSVRESQELIEDAREEIAGFRKFRAEELRLLAISAMDSGNFNSVQRILIELIALGGADSTLSQLRRRMEEARVYGGFRPGQVIKDQFLDQEGGQEGGQDRWAPSLIVISAGSFMMGSSATEKGRKDNEGPQHRVTFSRGFAIGQHEVTVSEFRVFVDQTRYKTDADRDRFSLVYDQHSGRLPRRDNVNWKMNYEGSKAGDDDPVVHVSWRDAQAYVNWLAQATGKPYRLPSEAEFEYALRGGKSTRYWWGSGAPRRLVENITGEGDTSRNHRNWSTSFKGYTDQFWGPAPVGSFDPSPYGLFDIGGNVGEWVMDCWHDTYMRAPVDGSGWVNPGCKLRVIRGGYWASSPEQTRSAFRFSAKPDSHDARIGFRIARDL
jgi:formylglycine-generating enzyme required for sulfatase activity